MWAIAFTSDRRQMTCLAQEKQCWVCLPPDLVEGIGVSVDAMGLGRWFSCGDSVSGVWMVRSGAARISLG